MVWVPKAQIAIANDLVTASLALDPGSQTRAAFQAIANALVSAALQADPTLAASVSATAQAAAVQKVGEAIIANDLIKGSDIRIPTSSFVAGVSIALLAAGDRYTFLTANDVDGAPTPHAAKLISKSIGMTVENAEGVSVAMLAAGDRFTFLTANDVDGGPTEHAAKLIAEYARPFLAIPDDSGTPTAYIPEVSSGDIYVTDLSSGQRSKLTTGAAATGEPEVVGSGVLFPTSAGRRWVPVTGGEVGPIFPTTEIVCRGDSHVSGFAGNGTNINTVLATELGVAVTSDGHGGWGSSDIALNAGAITALLTVTGNQIPASGAVTITSKVPSLGWRTFGGTTVINIPGILRAPSGDIPGSFRFDAATRLHTFVRTTGGVAVDCPPGTPFTSGNGHRDKTQIIWCGANDVPYGTDAEAAYSVYLANVAAMVNRQSSLAKRSLILSMPTGSQNYRGSNWHTRVTTANSRLATLYPDTYVDVRRHLIDFGLAEAGITPTTADLYSIERDTIPPSLLADDQTHLLAPGLTIVANLAAARMRALGWYPEG